MQGIGGLSLSQQNLELYSKHMVYAFILCDLLSHRILHAKLVQMQITGIHEPGYS